MTIKQVRIDDGQWEPAHRLRRDDWRVSIADLIDEARLGEEDDHLLHIKAADGSVQLATFDEQGVPREVLEIEHEHLRQHIDEYLAIIQRMQTDDASDSSSRIHALDMAKKVVHDAGAKTLARILPKLARDHESYRRLFSLLLALIVDVTKLPGGGSHRGHAQNA